MPQGDTDRQILSDARERARALLDALSRDAADLATSARFAEGAACCEDAAEQARRVIAALDAQLDTLDSP